MLTAFDKAIAPLVVAVIVYANQKFGWHLDASPESVATLIGGFSAALVYFIPNKAA